MFQRFTPQTHQRRDLSRNRCIDRCTDVLQQPSVFALLALLGKAAVLGQRAAERLPRHEVKAEDMSDLKQASILRSLRFNLFTWAKVRRSVFSSLGCSRCATSAVFAVVWTALCTLLMDLACAFASLCTSWSRELIAPTVCIILSTGAAISACGWGFRKGIERG